MAKLVVTSAANADVGEIYEYLLAEAGLLTAMKYRRQLAELFNHLALYPESCPRRPRLSAQTRVGIVSPYLVLYRYAEAGDTVFIQRIVHGRRRITRKSLRETN